MTRTRVGAWFARWGLAVGIVVAYLWSFPYFPAIRSANELPRAYLVRAMADRGTFAIDVEAARWGETSDMSPSGGHTYSNKAPGSSMLAVPAYLLASGVSRLVGAGEPSLALTVWVCRVWTGMIPTFLFLLLLWRFLVRWAPREDTRRLVLVAYALGSMAMTYSILFISHQLSAICIGTAWILAVWVVEDGLDVRWMLAAGAAAGAAPLVDYQAAFAGVPVAIYVVARLWGDRARLGRVVLLAIAGTVGPIALLLYYHWAAFGSPLRTGYNASVNYKALHDQGFLGLSRFRWEAFAGSMWAPDNGLVTFAPWFLAAIPGGVLLWKRGERRHAAVMAAVAIIYVWFVSSIAMWRGGWGVGPRYITVMLPFLLPGVAVAAAWADDDARRWWARGLLIGAILVGVVVYAMSSAEYPHFPEKFANPLYEVTLRLVRDDQAPWNAGWLFGLRGFASIAPYLAVVAATVAWAAWRDRRSMLLGVAIAVVVLAAYAVFPGGGHAADDAYVQWVRGVMPR